MTKQMMKIMSLISIGLLFTATTAVYGDDKATPTPVPTAEATAETVANPYADIPFSRTVDGAPVLGDPDAPITIIEFVDFACPHCQNYRPTMQQFIEEFVATGRAQYEFRYLPTAGGEMTAYVGNITSCFETQRPGVFWSLQDALYEQAATENYDSRMLRNLARRFGLNFLDAQICMSENIDEESLQVDIDSQLAYSLGVSGTPGVRARYKDHNDGLAQYLVADGVVWDKGGAPFEFLAQAVEDAEAGKIPDPGATPEVELLPGDPV
ncbi:MAG: DsbA family protein [Chloroflexi bacterium]|nr:DsbA family protein [Chloroflexota bacterium]MCC6893309.1 thioredoxin domain-containing protein [Anaerolineae bacterium]